MSQEISIQGDASPRQPQIDDGGPAFPHLHNTCQRVNETEHHEGLSVRDHFAGQFLAGYTASTDYESRDYESAADMAYRQADAMIAARKVGPPVAEINADLLAACEGILRVAVGVECDNSPRVWEVPEDEMMALRVAITALRGGAS